MQEIGFQNVRSCGKVRYREREEWQNGRAIGSGSFVKENKLLIIFRFKLSLRRRFMSSARWLRQLIRVCEVLEDLGLLQ